MIPRLIVAAIGSFDAGIFGIIAGAWMVLVVLFKLALMIRYLLNC